MYKQLIARSPRNFYIDRTCLVRSDQSTPSLTQAINADPDITVTNVSMVIRSISIFNCKHVLSLFFCMFFGWDECVFLLG